MTYLKQAGIILVISFIDELIKLYISLPIPASIYGFGILFVLLQTGAIKEKNVDKTGLFLIEIMPVMFIPGAVGLMDTWEEIKGNWHSICFIIVFSTIIVMIVAGKVTDLLLKGDNDATENC